MNKRRITRRDFITQSVVTGVAAGALSGCSMLDRFFGLEKSRFEEEIVIIGAGAAGLAAAYELKKAGIPFRLFEASSRIGGRVYSLENFNSDGQWAELGAESFDGSHGIIFELCKELNLPIEEVKWDQGLERQLTFSRGRVLTSKESYPKFEKLYKELTRLKFNLVGDRNEMVTRWNQNSFPLAAEFDRLSIADGLRQIQGNVDADALRAFENSCVAQFGMPVDETSLLHLINSIDTDPKKSSATYRIRFGNQRLLRTLYERISSVLPDFFVKLDSPLTEIGQKGGYFQCYFKTPEGNRKFEAKYVIFALPVNQYRRIKGFAELDLSPDKKISIQKIDLAAHTKTILSYRQKFWNKRQDALPANRGVYFKEYLPVITGDGSAGQAGTKGLLSFLAGGPTAQNYGADAAEQMIKEMLVFTRNFKSDYEGLNQTMNWKSKIYSEGSYAIYRPGDFLRFHGLWADGDYKGRLVYAGEHCHSTRFGTMAGALESGRGAAKRIVEIRDSVKKI